MKNYFNTVVAVLVTLQLFISTSWAVKDFPNADICEPNLKTDVNKAVKLEKAKSAFQKILQFEKEASEVLLEREKLISAMVSTAVVGGNMLIMGPPGTGKSKAKVILSKILNQEKVPSVFSRTLDRDTQRSEILGSLDPLELQKTGKYIRQTTQSMLHPLFAVLDEFFRARPGVFSYILEAFSDRTLSDGVTTFRGNLEAAYALTNGTLHDIYTIFEVDPTLGGADAPKAMFDRFLRTFYVTPLAHEENRTKVDLGLTKSADDITPIEIENIYDIREALDAVEFSPTLAKAFGQITDQILKKNNESEILGISEAQKNRNPYRYRTTKLLLDRIRGQAAKYLRYCVLKEWILDGGKRPLSVTIYDFKNLSDVYGLDGPSDEILNFFQSNWAASSPSDALQIKTIKSERASVNNTLASVFQGVQIQLISAVAADHTQTLALSKFNEFRSGTIEFAELVDELQFLKEELVDTEIHRNTLNDLQNKVTAAIEKTVTKIEKNKTNALRTTDELIKEGIVAEELKILLNIISTTLNPQIDITKLSEKTAELISKIQTDIRNELQQELERKKQEELKKKQKERDELRKKSRIESLKKHVLNAHAQIASNDSYKVIENYVPDSTNSFMPHFLTLPNKSEIYHWLFKKDEHRHVPSTAELRKITINASGDATTEHSQNILEASDPELKTILSADGVKRIPPLIALDTYRMLAIHKNIGIIFDPTDLSKKIIHKFLIANSPDFLTSYDPNSKELFVLDRKNTQLKKFDLAQIVLNTYLTEDPVITTLVSSSSTESVNSILSNVIPQSDIHNNTLNDWATYRDHTVKRSFFVVDPKTETAWFSFSRPEVSELWSIDLKTGVMSQAYTLPAQSIPVGLDQESMTVFFLQLTKKASARHDADKNSYGAQDSKYIIVELREKNKFQEFQLNVDTLVSSKFEHHWLVPDRFLIMSTRASATTHDDLSQDKSLVYDVLNNRVVAKTDSTILEKCASGKLIRPDLYACFDSSNRSTILIKLNFNIP